MDCTCQTLLLDSQWLNHKRDNKISDAPSCLTFGSMLRYRAAMPIQFILPKKFTRAQIEWRVDELALRFQGTKDKKIIAQIAALNRVLAKMEAQSSDSSQLKNRQ